MSAGSTAPAASCLACGKSGGKLLRCARCKSVLFCNRECQVVAVKMLGHKGVNCRPAGVAQAPQVVRAPSPEMIQRYKKLFQGGRASSGHAATEKFKAAAVVGDLIGGASGSFFRAESDQLLATTYCTMGNNLGAAGRAACSALRAARSSGNCTLLVTVLRTCGVVAAFMPTQEATDEMGRAEMESREQCSPSHGGLDISQEGRISLPATWPRMGLAYYEAAVATCDAALAAAGGVGSPALADQQNVPSPHVEAQARAALGAALHILGEEQQRSFELLRQSVSLLRQVVRTASPGYSARETKQELANQLCNLGVMHIPRGQGAVLSFQLPNMGPIEMQTVGCFQSGPVSSDGVAEARACLREALKLCKATGEANIQRATMANLDLLSRQPKG